jgi:hypothetical protein
MKTRTTIKHILLALTIALCIVSCSKDKKTTPTPAPVLQEITFEDLLKLSTGTSVKVPANTKITGIVISDISNKNIDPKTIVLQEATGKAGIVVTFTAAQKFALGDQVDVNISGQTLAQVNGEVELTNIPANNATKSGTGTIIPAVTNAAAIIQNATAMDGTLVTIPATGFSGASANYTGTLTVTDSTGTLSSAILVGATFQDTAYPASLSSLTGIVRISGTTVYVDLRNKADAVVGAITKIITDNFTNLISKYTGTAAQPGDFLYEGFTDNVSTGSGWSATAGGTLYLFPGSQYDAGFTEPGRNYLYMVSAADQSNLLVGATFYCDLIAFKWSNLQNLKQVSVTFAGSNMSGGGLSIGNVVPFNPATDYFQIAVVSIMGNYTETLPLIQTSAKYTSAGQFHTFTYAYPTKAQLLALGASPDQMEQVLLRPLIQIVNMSQRSGAPYNQLNLINAPIVIDKVVFGF